MSFPRLIENNASYFLQNTLQKCHENRVNVYYYVINIMVLLLFVFIVGFTLYYCYNNKLSDYDKQQKLLKDQEFIVSKIRYYQEEVKQTNNNNSSMITDLPSIRV
jgi:hypothetical protein